MRTFALIAAITGFVAADTLRVDIDQQAISTWAETTGENIEDANEKIVEEASDFIEGAFGWAQENSADLLTAIQEKQALQDQFGQDICNYVLDNVYYNGSSLRDLGAGDQLKLNFNSEATTFQEMFALDKLDVANGDITSFQVDFDQDALATWANEKLQGLGMIVQLYM